MSGGFNNPIIGGGGNLVYPAIQSPNFVDSTSGWQIAKDGSAEFNNLEIRGTFNGSNYILNSSGEFFYNGTPAAGNLIMSVVGGPNGTDAFGNNYLGQAFTFYDNVAGFAISIGNDAIAWFSGSLAAGWASNSPILQRVASGTLSLDNPVLIGAINPVTSSTLEVQGDIAISTAGNGLRIKEGTNARMGHGALSAGSLVVADTSVTASTRILAFAQTTGANSGALGVSARTPGTGFTISSTNGADGNAVAWLLIEPA